MTNDESIFECTNARNPIVARASHSSIRTSNIQSNFVIRHSSFRAAFTLTEILIVIALIVLMLALALPAFNFITGGRSINGAQNQLAALLARARAEAIGLQEIRGLFFFIDPRTPDRVSAALVKQSPAKEPAPAGPDDPNVDLYLDLVPDTDFLQLPKGVGLQLVDDYRVNAGVAQDDRYIGFNNNGNTAGTTEIKFGGAILFDGNGMLKSAYYGFRNSLGPNVSGAPTGMGFLMFQLPTTTTATPSDFVPRRASGNPPPRSQFGLVLFDLPTFENRGFTAADPQIDSGLPVYLGSGEVGEESWLDNNATAVLINRYNGTLVKGE